MGSNPTPNKNINFATFQNALTIVQDFLWVIVPKYSQQKCFRSMAGYKMTVKVAMTESCWPVPIKRILRRSDRKRIEGIYYVE